MHGFQVAHFMIALGDDVALILLSGWVSMAVWTWEAFPTLPSTPTSMCSTRLVERGTRPVLVNKECH